MGGFPTSRDATAQRYNRRSTLSDGLLLSRLDRRVQPYPLVRSDAVDRSNWLCGQLDLRFIPGELLVFTHGTVVYPTSRAT